jgi:hypothetical protein
MAGDEIHRIFGQKLVHRRALLGGMVGGPFLVACGGSDQPRLHQCGKNGDAREHVGRQFQA